jgi:hypothetical protein
VLEAEVVQGATDSVCEAGYSAANPVLLRERAPLLNQGAALFVKRIASGVDLLGATFHFSKLEQSALIEIDQATAFAAGRLNFAFEAL